MQNIRLQQEHDKILKDLIYVFGINDKRIKQIQDERNKITDEINYLLKDKK